MTPFFSANVFMNPFLLSIFLLALLSAFILGGVESAKNSLRTFGDEQFQNITWELYRFIARPEFIVPPITYIPYEMTLVNLDKIIPISETIISMHSWEYDPLHSNSTDDPFIDPRHHCGYIVHTVNENTGNSRMIKLPCPGFEGAVLDEEKKIDFERTDLKQIERERHESANYLPGFLAVRNDNIYVHWDLVNNTLEEISFANGTVTKPTDVIKLIQLSRTNYIIHTNDDRLIFDCEGSSTVIENDIDVLGNSKENYQFYYTKKANNTHIMAAVVLNSTCEIFTAGIGLPGLENDEKVMKIDSEMLLTSEGRFFSRQGHDFKPVPYAIGQYFTTLEVAYKRSPALAFLIDKKDNRAYYYEYTSTYMEPVNKIQGKYSLLSGITYGSGATYHMNGVYVVDAVTCFDVALDDPSVCSGHGTCIATNICDCARGYYDPDCRSSSFCQGIPSVDSRVCSGNGECRNSKCLCKEGFTGDSCSTKIKEQVAIITVSVLLSVLFLFFVLCIIFCCCTLICAVGIVCMRSILKKKHLKDRGITGSTGWVQMKEDELQEQ